MTETQRKIEDMEKELKAAREEARAAGEEPENLDRLFNARRKLQAFLKRTETLTDKWSTNPDHKLSQDELSTLARLLNLQLSCQMVGAL